MIRTHRAAVAAATLAGLAAVASAAEPVTVFKLADEWGTINSTGPRTGVNGVRYWNAEGSNNGSFGSTATLRFYTDDVVAQFDAQFGAGKWKVTNVNIVFSQSNSSFTAPGPANLYWFANDSLPITNGVDDGTPGQFSSLGVSPLRYAAGVNPLDTQLADGTTDANAIFGNYSKVDTYQFTGSGSGGDWPLDVLAPKNSDGAYNLINPEDLNIQVGSPNYGIAPPIVNGSHIFRSDTMANFDADTQRVQSNLDLGPIAADIESRSSALSFLLIADAAAAVTYKGNPNAGDYPPRIYITAQEIGDANGDGVINADDFALIDRGFAMNLTGFSNGDFNGDGVVDQSDYLLIDTMFAEDQGGQLSPAFLASRESQFGEQYVQELVAAVPEPTGLGVCLIASLATAATRRRGPAPRI